MVDLSVRIISGSWMGYGGAMAEVCGRGLT